MLECVVWNDDGTYLALFGYNNPGQTVVNIPLGPYNFFTPEPADRGQPTSFQPGRSRVVFEVTWDGQRELVWTLNGKTATASANPAQRCRQGER